MSLTIRHDWYYLGFFCIEWPWGNLLVITGQETKEKDETKPWKCQGRIRKYNGKEVFNSSDSFINLNLKEFTGSADEMWFGLKALAETKNYYRLGI